MRVPGCVRCWVLAQSGSRREDLSIFAPSAFFRRCVINILMVSADDEMPKLHKNRSEVLVSVILGLKILMIPSGWELQRSALFTVASSRRGGLRRGVGCHYDILMCLAPLSAHSLPALQLFSQIVLDLPTIATIPQTI